MSGKSRQTQEFKSPAIRAVRPGEGDYALVLSWDDGTETAVDLTEPIFRLKYLRPLRNKKRFRKVQVSDWGWAVSWGDNIDYAGEQLWELSRSQAGAVMTPSQFRTWLTNHGLTQHDAARLLGVSKRSIAYYATGAQPITRTIFLAIQGLKERTPASGTISTTDVTASRAKRHTGGSSPQKDERSAQSQTYRGMSATPVAFQNIRPFADGQRSAFEELCCQIARRAPEVLPQSTFYRFRGAGGDGGVEAIWESPSGSKWGFQAKFFMSLGFTQKREMEASLLKAIQIHSTLTRYTFCLPIDLTGPRTNARRTGGRVERSETEKLKNWIVDWEKVARKAGIDLAIDSWDASELRTRLIESDPFGGRRRYWFDQAALPTSWFESHLKDAVAQAGRRYSPQLSIDVPLAGSLEALGRTEVWRQELRQHVKDARQRIEHWDHVIDEKRQKEGIVPLTVESISEALQLSAQAKEVVATLRSMLTRIASSEERALTVSRLEQLIAVGRNCERVAVSELEAKHGEGVSNSASFRQFMAEYQVAFPAAVVDAARELVSALERLRRWIGVEHGHLANEAAVLVTGAAGVGKTHALVDHALSRLKRGYLTVLLFGEDFSTATDMWTIVGTKLGFGSSLSRDEILDALDAAFEASGETGIFAIDALNETAPSRSVWQRWLPVLISQTLRRANIRICVSCRDTYLSDVRPEGLGIAQIDHNGFAGREMQAARMFFEHYGIEKPSVPLFQPEFGNPLFLHMLCGSLRDTGQRRLPDSPYNLTNVIEWFLEGKNKRVADALDYDPKERRVHSAVNAIVKAIADGQHRTISWAAAKESVDRLYPANRRSESLFDQLIREGVLAEGGTPPTHFVRFSFERMGDHLLARMLLEGMSPHQIISAFKDKDKLGRFFESEDSARQNLGLLEALAIQLPEHVDVEIDEVGLELPRERMLLPILLNSFPWRSARSAMRRGPELVWEALGTPQASSAAVELLLSLAPRPEHPLNAEFLDATLRRMAMADRDGFWCGILYKRYGQNSSLDRLIEWALFGPLDGINLQAVRLWAMSLAWCCAAADRRVRDRATKAMVQLFRVEAAAIGPTIEVFANVNDDYVFERVLCSAYGALLLISDDRALRNAAIASFSAVFQGDTEATNALIRDHARLILERALEHGVLDATVEPSKFRPPYRSAWPIDLPTEGDIAAYKDRDDLPHMLLNSFGHDFAIYTIGSKVVRPFKVDAPAVYRWFLREALALGYPGAQKRCAAYDYRMLREHGGGRAKPRWAERIGKKYYWILLQRLVGQLSDHMQVQRDSWDPDIPDARLPGLELRDIDPTDLRVYRRALESVSEPGIRPNAKYRFGQFDVARMREWIAAEDFISPSAALSFFDDNGDEWLPFYVTIEWEQTANSDEDYPRRAVDFVGSGFLVAQQSLASWRKAARALKGHLELDHNGLSAYRTYLGEYPGALPFQQQNGTSQYLVECDSVPLERTFVSFLREFEYDASEDAGEHSRAPAPRFIIDCSLRWDGDRSWVSEDDRIQVSYCSRRTDEQQWSALLVRRDFLAPYLDEHQLGLVWATFHRKIALSGLFRGPSFGVHEHRAAVELSGVELKVVAQMREYIEPRDDA